MLDLNRAPYYDDYDSDKKFHRILYRPSYAVQTRELTQQQTILQNQIARFGNHIFKNGAMVIPGQITFDAGMHYVKIDDLYGGQQVIVNDFLNYKVEGQTSGVIAQVVNASDIENSDPKTLYLKYLSAGTSGEQVFDDGEILQRTDNSVYNCTSASSSSTGLGTASSINAGVYYINGFFVNVDAQTIIVSKYLSTPTTRIGLKLYEYLIDSDDDNSLTDNAQGSYNYAAPGAHRYKLDLLLETADTDADLTDDFIELQYVENGILINEIRTTEYNELEKNLARRTFDESGDYTVRPFNVNVKEHLLDSTVDRYVEGKYLVGDGGDSTKLALGIEPGKAYVRGYERVKLATTWIETNKARTTGFKNNTVTNFGIGQYVYITDVFQVPDFSIFDTIELHGTAVTTDGTTPGNSIGYARARAIELVESGATNDLDVYKLYLFDINLDDGYIWDAVLGLYSSDTDLEFTANTALDSGSSYYDYRATVIEATKKVSIFKLPHQYIKTLEPNGTETHYTVQKTFTGQVLNASGSVTLNASTGQSFDAFTNNNYIMQDENAANSAASFIDIADAVPSGTSVTITTTGGAANDGLSVRIIAPLYKPETSARSKTIVGASATYYDDITSPNTIPGGYDDLDQADGIELFSVTLDPTGTPTDITDRYTFDNGQRDGFYDRAKIRLKQDATPPVSTDTLRVTFSYYSHGSTGDYFSVDSYPDPVTNYNDIGVYYSSGGEQYDLSDCIDFRPVMNGTGTTFVSPGELPWPRTNVTADYDYYLPRIDKLYMDYTGSFHVLEGTPAEVPEPPKSPSDGMVLYTIYMNAYTFSTDEAKLKFIDNKRYTMRDIGNLEKRINTLEYYTTLSLLEKDTAQFQIQDATTGLDRFKNGFIVEPFKSHEIGDNTSPDYRCAIDPNDQIMRPTYSASSIKMEYSTADSSNTQETGPLVTLPYTETSVISQLFASTTENVNPFAVRLYEGKITFQPDSDNWYDSTKNGDLVVNDDANFAALQFMANNAKGLEGKTWGAWETQWSSTSSSTSLKRTGTTTDRSRSHDDGQLQNIYQSVSTTTTTKKQKRTGTITSPSETTVNKSLGDRTIGINYIPYMRSIPVLVKVESMMPGCTVYPFFDDISVADFVTPAVRIAGVKVDDGSFTTAIGKEETVTTTGGGSATILFASDDLITIVNWNGSGFLDTNVVTGSESGATFTLSAGAVATTEGDSLVVDDKGRIALIFNIPSTDTVKFRTGERVFLLTDQVNNSDANQTKAESIFRSEGSMLQTEGTILSTKTIRFDQEPITQKRTIQKSSSNSTSGSTTTGKWYDPLAQTFLIEEEGGCFITACDVYFKDICPEGLPVNFQIREVVNGYPGQAILPYSEVTVDVSEISATDDASIATTIEMQAPVYVEQGAEYCFVLLTDSFDYNIWISELGQVDLTTGNMISKQPYNGVLFKSQNASTWTANQAQDMKFNLYKAVFDAVTPGSSILYNESVPIIPLGSAPIETFYDSLLVRVHHTAHGFDDTGASSVTLSELSEANGILAVDLNTTHTVVSVENDSYIIDISDVSGYTSPVATSSARGGGTVGYATTNVPMDVIRPNVAELILPGTLSEWEIKATSARSINGVQDQYIQSTTFGGINITENNWFLNPMMIASTENETANLSGDKSLIVRNTMSTDNVNVSPVIDLNRSSVIAVGNRINSATVTAVADLATVTVAASLIITVTHIDHGMATGAYITITDTENATLDGIPKADLLSDFPILRIDEDTYSFESPTAASAGISTETIDITYSTDQYKYVPENIGEGGSAVAKYQTRKITVEEEAIAVKILLTAVLQNYSEFEIWYRKQGPYDSSLFADIEWTLIDDPDIFVPLSQNVEDFRDYEYTLEFTDDPFTSIAIKLVMKSTDSTKVPIFDNIRVICLGS